MWEDYEVEGGTLRENLYSTKGMSMLRDDHYGHLFKYGSGFLGDGLTAWDKEKAEQVTTDTNGAPAPAAKRKCPS
jgi:hypothetical protein